MGYKKKFDEMQKVKAYEHLCYPSLGGLSKTKEKRKNQVSIIC